MGAEKMSILTTLKNLFTPKRQPITLHMRALPSGRASRDSEDSFPFRTWVIAPPPDYEHNWQLLRLDSQYLDRLSPARLMEVLADFSPEVSRALWDFLRMCNPGWEYTAKKPGSDTEDKRARDATEAFIKLLADEHGSFDVLVGRLFMGPFLRGAFCAELVLDRRGRLPIDLATPDPGSIRFRRRDDEVRGEVWQPGQWQQNFVPLDIPTFRYLPVDPFPSSPYGRPLAAPALSTALFLLGMLHDLRRVIQQQGYPRLDIAIQLEKIAAAMPQLGADPAAFDAYVNSLVKSVQDAYSQLDPDDAYIHSDTVVVNKPVGAVDASSLGAIDGIIKGLERMLVRALKSMPLMMGLQETTTESQANRTWEIYAASIKSIQHYCEALLDRLLTLALEAQGIQAVVEFRFAELRAAEMLRDAQTEAMQIANESAKYAAGWTSQDESSEAITGHPADAPEPRSVTIAREQAEQMQQDDGDGEERLDQNSDRTGYIAEIRQALAEVNVAMERISYNGYH